MLRTQIYIPEKLHQSAKSLAKKQGKSFAQVLREMIEHGVQENHFKDRASSLQGIVNLNITGGPKDLSQHLDNYLYDLPDVR